MERITVVGMGPLGTSLGLALKNIRLKNTEVVGHFLNRRTQSEVKKMAAFDVIEGNLDKAVNGAQLVVIDSPINETRDLFETLGSIVSDGAVITDMGSSKKRSAAWAEEFLPNTVSYVGGRPIIKAELNGVDSENEIDLFTRDDTDGWKVYYFYPKDFTFICPTEIAAMDRLVDEYVDDGYYDDYIGEMNIDAVNVVEFVKAD